MKLSRFLNMLLTDLHFIDLNSHTNCEITRLDNPRRRVLPGGALYLFGLVGFQKEAGGSRSPPPSTDSAESHGRKTSGQLVVFFGGGLPVSQPFPRASIEPNTLLTSRRDLLASLERSLSRRPGPRCLVGLKSQCRTGNPQK